MDSQMASTLFYELCAQSIYMRANSVLQYVVTDFYQKILNFLNVWFHGAHSNLYL